MLFRSALYIDVPSLMRSTDEIEDKSLLGRYTNLPGVIAVHSGPSKDDGGLSIFKYKMREYGLLHANNSGNAKSISKPLAILAEGHKDCKVKNLSQSHGQ